MADVEIKYNNATIASLSDSGTEVLETNGKLCEDDITIDYTKPTPNLQSKTASPTTSSQTITADSGYDGLSQVTVNAISPTKTAQTYTPTTTDQTIQSGRWLTGNQTIKGDANLVASNIANGVSIFGVTGTYGGSGGTFSGPYTAMYAEQGCAYWQLPSKPLAFMAYDNVFVISGILDGDSYHTVVLYKSNPASEYDPPDTQVYFYEEDDLPYGNFEADWWGYTTHFDADMTLYCLL